MTKEESDKYNDLLIKIAVYEQRNNLLDENAVERESQNMADQIRQGTKDIIKAEKDGKN